MKIKYYLLLLTLLFVVSGCREEYSLQPGAILQCHTHDFDGYVVADTVGDPCNTGKLYIDSGSLLVHPEQVSFDTQSKTLYISGNNIKRQPCQLTPYIAPVVQEISGGYSTSQYAVDRKTDQKFGSAEGYWASYPETNEKHAVKFLKKAVKLFGSKKAQDLEMDIYTPRGDSFKSRPLLVMIHGGAFYCGDKSDKEYKLWCRQFAERGYVAVSINYRMGFGLGPFAMERAAYRASQDTHAAIRYLLKHKDQYHIDPNRIYMAGCSAGAISALHTAFMSSENRPVSTEGKLMLFGHNIGAAFSDDLGAIDAVRDSINDYRQPFRINAVCSMWGAIFDLNMLKNSKTSILSIHSANDPIVPFRHGIPFADELGDFADMLVPTVYGSAEIHARAKRLGITSEIDSFAIAKHTLIEDNDGNLNNLHEVFLDRMLTFFEKDMEKRHRISLQTNRQHCLIKSDEPIAQTNWTVTGGVVIRQEGSSIDCLLFADQPNKSIVASGVCGCGVPFSKSMSWN